MSNFDKNQFYPINIGKEYTFVSDLPESITSQFDNCYIDKTLTGCGFTTWALQNNESYIVAVPFKGLIDCKVEQANNDTTGFYPHKVFPFCSGSIIESKKDIKWYHTTQNKDRVLKIMVTYDSVPLLIEYLTEIGIDVTKIKLLVDECHKVLDFAGLFKPVVINNLEQSYDCFKSVIAVTATPSRIDCIPKGFDNFKRIKLDWDNKLSVACEHVNINMNQVKEALCAIALKHIRNEAPGNAYIFINSLSTAATIIKTLLNMNCVSVSRSDFNVICGEGNEKLLRPLKLDNSYNIHDKFAKINFITSTAFEGQDFMDPDGVTYIVSTGHKQYNRIDISTQLPQIIGRLRCSKYKNKFTFIWSYAFTEGETNLIKYEDAVMQEESDNIEMIDELNENLSNKTKAMTNHRMIADGWWFSDIDELGNVTFTVNMNMSKSLINAFIGTQLQYFAHWNMNEHNIDRIFNDTHGHVKYTLNDVLSGSVKSNYNVPSLSASDKLKLNRKADFGKLTKEYAFRKLKMLQNPTGSDIWLMAKEVCDSIEQDPTLIDIVDYVKTFGIDGVLNSTRPNITLSKHRIKKSLAKYHDNKVKSNITEILKKEFSAGDVIKASDLKQILLDIFDKHGITGISPKRSLLAEVFEVKNSTISENGIRSAAIKLQQRH